MIIYWLGTLLNYLEVSENEGYPDSWMVYFMETMIKMDDLGVSQF